MMVQTGDIVRIEKHSTMILTIYQLYLVKQRNVANKLPFNDKKVVDLNTSYNNSFFTYSQPFRLRSVATWKIDCRTLYTVL